MEFSKKNCPGEMITRLKNLHNRDSFWRDQDFAARLARRCRFSASYSTSYDGKTALALIGGNAPGEGRCENASAEALFEKEK